MSSNKLLSKLNKFLDKITEPVPEIADNALNEDFMVSVKQVKHTTPAQPVQRVEVNQQRQAPDTAEPDAPRREQVHREGQPVYPIHAEETANPAGADKTDDVQGLQPDYRHADDGIPRAGVDPLRNRPDGQAGRGRYRRRMPCHD